MWTDDQSGMTEIDRELLSRIALEVVRATLISNGFSVESTETIITAIQGDAR